MSIAHPARPVITFDDERCIAHIDGVPVTYEFIRAWVAPYQEDNRWFRVARRADGAVSIHMQRIDQARGER